MTFKITLLLFISTALLFLYSCSYSSKAAKKLYASAEKKSYDIIVVPGVQFENDVWNRTMKGRVYWAKYLYDKGIAKNIMFSGSAVYTPYYEAKIMALYAEALGIPKDHIFIETRAEHSTENIYYSYKKAKQLGFNTIALASDPFQTKRLRKFIWKKVSPDIDIIPFVVDTLKMLEPNMITPSINYAEAVAEVNFKSLPERENFWKRLRGTRGLNMDLSAYDSK